MGDWFQSIVDCDATEFESPGLGASIHEWLVKEGIVSGDATDCVLGSKMGYPPGPNYLMAVDGPGDNLLRLRTNGFDVISVRSVFHSGQGGFELVCSSCGSRIEAPEEWEEAVGEWYEKRGPGLLSCPNCRNRESIKEWEHDPAWGFADLGFIFWNWPPLTDGFVKQFGERLGHRVVLIAGKL